MTLTEEPVGNNVSTKIIYLIQTNALAWKSCFQRITVIFEHIFEH